MRAGSKPQTIGGGFLAKSKSDREFVASKTFGTKREATEWLARERAPLAGGVDPRLRLMSERIQPRRPK
jgi:hypothetical protein